MFFNPMYVFKIIPFITLLLHIASAQIVTNETFNELPACAAECPSLSIEETTCSLTDAACLCRNKHFWQEINTCALYNCDPADQINAVKIFASECKLKVRDRSRSFLAGIWSTTILGCVTVVIRLASRIPKPFHSAIKYGWDDTLIIIALAVVLPASLLNQFSVPLGFGRDLWGLNPDNISKISLYQWVQALCYLMSTTITKASLIIFLARIFPDRRFVIWCWAVLGVMTVMNTVMTLTYAFQCNPISFIWTSLNDPVPGPFDDVTCINMNVWRWTSGISTIFWDVVIIIMPLPQLYKLNLPLRKKLHVIMMFSTGLVVIATVCGECAYLTTLTTNPTWDYVPLLSLFSAEAYVSIICACMPAIHAFLKIYFPTSMGSTMVGTKGSKGSVAPLNSSRATSTAYTTRKVPSVASTNQIMLTREIDISWDDPEDHNIGKLRGEKYTRV